MRGTWRHLTRDLGPGTARLFAATTVISALAVATLAGWIAYRVATVPPTVLGQSFDATEVAVDRGRLSRILGLGCRVVVVDLPEDAPTRPADYYMAGAPRLGGGDDASEVLELCRDDLPPGLADRLSGILDAADRAPSTGPADDEEDEATDTSPDGDVGRTWVATGFLGDALSVYSKADRLAVYLAPPG